MHIHVSSSTNFCFRLQFWYLFSLQTHPQALELHTLFGPHCSGALLQMHLQWLLLQIIPCPQGSGGVSSYLHLHWHWSCLHSSNSGSHLSGLITHSQPQRVWFFSLMILVSLVPITCTVTGTSLNWSGVHDSTEGCTVSHDPPHRWSFTKYGKNL